MLARAAITLSALLLLAGCSGPSPSDDAFSETPAETFSVVADNRIGPRLTDTYHLLALPAATPTPPTAAEPVRIPVTTAFRPAEVAQPVDESWDLVLPQDLPGLVGTARVWVEVKGPLLGNPFSLTTGGCFWSLNGMVAGESDGFVMGCLADELQVAEGVHELVFAFALPEKSWPAGTVLEVEFHTFEWAERAPGTTVEVLTGSAGHDSAIQVYGMELPLGETALLSA